jgi:hypothetical protein
MSETEIPFLNLHYNASSDGYLEIVIIPIEGPVPYIEIDDTWATDGLNYVKKMVYNETAVIKLTPSLSFSDYSSSRVVDGGITLFEMYNWSRLFGEIDYSFTKADEISIDFDWHPTMPRQEDEITFFTISEYDLNNITWEIEGNDFKFNNNTEIFKIELESGEYSVTVKGYDEFSHNHSMSKKVFIEPPLIEKEFFDIQLFTLDYPDSLIIGDTISITAIIDYYVPNSMKIKLVLMDPTLNLTISEITNTLNGNGTSKYILQHIPQEPGNMNLRFNLYYDSQSGWVELIKAKRVFNILVTNIEEPKKSIPGFSSVAMFLGIMVFYLLIRKNMVASR